MAGRRKKLGIALIALVALGALGVGGWFGWKAYEEKQFLVLSPELEGRLVTFRVEQGQPFSTIARNLKEKGLITDTRLFTRLAVREGSTGNVRAGAFHLSTDWKPEQVLKELTSSPGILARITVREGLSWWKTADIVARSGMGDRTAFAIAIRDPQLIAEFNIPADTLEGYLFPETYLLTVPERSKARFMVRTMVQQFFRQAARLWPGGLPEPKKLHEYVIMASLVEKETGDGSERPRIGGVLANRLERRMLLQFDPTIIYGLGPAFDGNIKRSHLTDRNNPYNTYVHAGLPPGPICSPGLESLRAAAFPEEHRFLYFVAKGDGTHYFSKSLKEHNAAVTKYQLRRNRKTYRSTKQ